MYKDSKKCHFVATISKVLLLLDIFLISSLVDNNFLKGWQNKNKNVKM